MQYQVYFINAWKSADVCQYVTLFDTKCYIQQSSVKIAPEQKTVQGNTKSLTCYQLQI